MNPLAQSKVLHDYLAAFDIAQPESTPVEQVRFVVLDTETTGLDPQRDRLITIGAVAVKGNEILLDDEFEAMLKIAYNSSSVTVHGITREEAEDGLDEPDALEAFLQYARDGVIVGHHIGHDVQMLDQACKRNFGFGFRNRSLDTMDLTLLLSRDGGFNQAATPNGFSLDALCDLFGIAPRDRHTAGGDAFLTAQIFLRLLRISARVGRNTLNSLLEKIPSEM